MEGKLPRLPQTRRPRQTFQTRKTRQRYQSRVWEGEPRGGSRGGQPRRAPRPSSDSFAPGGQHARVCEVSRVLRSAGCTGCSGLNGVHGGPCTWREVLNEGSTARSMFASAIAS
eukprot:3860816-Rhodomonas_salina.1